ncbi:MAG TPA: peptidoglycan DD-metalloendopeptidase family protein, partial [Bacteroidia bacterium]
KMSDAQLLALIDHMFEASYMPTDLWNQVMMETAKRNLSKLTRLTASVDNSCSSAYDNLHIEKLVPDSVAPMTDPEMMYLYPAKTYYNDWDENTSIPFKDEFTKDTSYTLELENSEYGCFKMPAWGPLSSPFGWRHNRYHKGIDIQLRKGDTITCAFDGMVRLAKRVCGYGNVVIVRHYNGLETVYAHLSKINVKEGDVIGSGDLVGLAGTTGHSTGPHLHFEVRFMGVAVDPQYFISIDYGSLLFNTVQIKKNKAGLLSAFNPSTEFHTVQKGETMIEIANHYGISSAKLRDLNGINSKQYFHLKEGMTLKVREIQREESASK